MKILITGFSGTLGSALAKLLAENGHQLRALLHGAAIDNQNHALRAEIVWGSLSQPHLFDGITQDMDAVVHCAWERHGAQQSALEKANLDGTINLIKSAERNNVKTFVHVSSVGVYGLCRSFWGKVLHESHPLVTEKDSLDPYPRIKVLIERNCEQLRGKLKMNLIIIRPGLLFSDTKGPAKKLISFRDRQYGILVGRGKNHLPYIHVDDVAEMISTIIENPPIYAVYNCAPTKYLAAAQFLKKWGKCRGHPVKALRLPPLALRAATWSVRKLKSALGRKTGASNINYQILTGIRDIRYSADKAVRELGWRDNQSRLIASV